MQGDVMTITAIQTSISSGAVRTLDDATLASVWSAVGAWLNTSIASSTVGSLAGAALGALAAFLLADKAKLRDELTKEIRSTNAALSLTFAICNQALALKKQHIKDLVTRYNETRIQAEQANAAGALGNPPAEPIAIQFNLQSLQPLRLPVAELQSHVFDRISLVGRPLSAAISLAEVAGWLELAISTRNALISKFKASGGNAAPNFISIYFGFQYGGGHVDEEYSGTMEMLERYTDDIIFFSELLGQDLTAHGEVLLKRYKRYRLGKVAMRITHLDFSPARAEGLMPSELDYGDWLKAFPTQYSAP